jgi:hypothetical protein
MVSNKTSNMADILLGGPLKPGVKVEIDEDKVTKEDLLTTIEMTYRSASRKADIQIPSMVWNLLREDDGPFELLHRSIERGVDNADPLPISKPSLINIEVDEGTTADEVKDFISGSFGNLENIHFGILEGGKEGYWTISMIHPIGKNSTHSEHSLPNPQMRSFDEMMDIIARDDFGPGRDLQ